MGSEPHNPQASSERILVLAPTGRDAELLFTTLGQAGFVTTVCSDMEALCAALPYGGAVAVVAEEAMGGAASDRLDAALAAQPSWSDLPIIVLLASGATLASSRALLSRFSQHGNLTLLERPTRSIALLSTLQAALRARHRQYEVRDHLISRAAAQAALERSEARYRSLTMASASIVWITDPSGEFTTEVPSWEAYTGQSRPAYAGWGWVQAVHPEDREAVVTAWRRALERNEGYYAEYRLLRSDGQYRRVTARGVPVLGADGAVAEWVGTCTDVEDERRAAEHLRQAQRLEAVGSLAGGMAHEVNNMMTAVIGFGGLVLKALPADHPQRSDVAEMVKAAHRAAGITRQLLAFTRQQVLQLSVLDLNAVVRNVSRMLGSFLGADIDLITELDSDAGRVRADPGQLEQVIVNLALNARHAMQSGGQLKLTTSPVEFDGSYLARHPGVSIREGPYTALYVSDTGVGMDALTRSRAFEPFFTTKPVGQGTGLGLSTAYGIIKQLEGYIWLYSEPGQGTTVKLYLPRVVAAADQPVRPKDPPRGRGETILIVEDEEAVRTFARRTLEEAGYHVVEATEGKQALEKLEAEPTVALVLCDVVLPEMSGDELARRLNTLRPGIPVLYMSGYPGREVVDRGLVARDAPFIEKPFTAEGLASVIRRLLDFD
ncbi:MAG TPA: response regulator [Gemmatimonadales bacterium]|nr:response regulator [Gemmatimonadales bacterium]